MLSLHCGRCAVGCRHQLVNTSPLNAWLTVTETNQWLSKRDNFSVTVAGLAMARDNNSTAFMRAIVTVLPT